jgi:glutamyl-tRNA reductase
MEILVHGLNHRTAPLELREKVAFLPEEATEAIRELHGHDSVSEIAVLSTCNRTEFYLISERPDTALEEQIRIVKKFKNIDLREADITYLHRQRECVEHLFRVAGGIDSMVIGEVGILGQVKNAFELAEERQSIGSIFGKLFPLALRVGKRSRNETQIGRGAVSVEKAGVQLAQKVFGDLSRRSVLVIGAGATGARVAEFLHEAGTRELTFANRTLARAEELAQCYEGRATGVDELATEVGHNDIVVTAVNTPEPILGHEVMKNALDLRRKRPLLVVDLGVPRNVVAEAARLEGVFLYAVDDLQELVNLNLGRRKNEIPAVEKIVHGEANRFFDWIDSLETAPVVVALREQVDRVRRDSLARVKGKLSGEERELLEKFSITFMNKILHGPTVSVRKCKAGTHSGLSQLHWTRRIFGLDVEINPNGEPPEEER